MLALPRLGRLLLHTEGTSGPPLCPASPGSGVMASVKAGGGSVDDVAARPHVGASGIAVLTLVRVITTKTIPVIGCDSRHNLGMPRLLSKWRSFECD